jgi:type VI protein secretion system component Hcp
MILMHLKEIKGDSKIPGYIDWITLTSFSFGAQQKIEQAKRGGGNDLETGKTGADSQEFSVDKSADIATVDLMYASIKHRASGQASAPFMVDIAFIEPRHNWDDKSDKSAIKAYMKLRFGKALIKQWSLNGSNTNRATESLTFWYNQVAIAYDAPTADGKSYQTYGPRGWDQLEGKDWVPSGWK